ncbi:hypothetical protein AVEN_89570-1 [Araneus ventricosus]|uniref:Uncharacterized protein n=1 Tax=Araneus ventricosus TaxID=182803 RepID=A0A4Y2GVN6_ARAVE|nr:hypothetical protein AVEN_89570-1 [Araneus ventricosus]
MVLTEVGKKATFDNKFHRRKRLIDNTGNRCLWHRLRCNCTAHNSAKPENFKKKKGRLSLRSERRPLPWERLPTSLPLHSKFVLSSRESRALLF